MCLNNLANRVKLSCMYSSKSFRLDSELNLKIIVKSWLSRQFLGTQQVLFDSGTYFYSGGQQVHLLLRAGYKVAMRSENVDLIKRTLFKLMIWRSSHPVVFCKKAVLRNSAKFTGKHLCQNLFLNKVAGHLFYRTSPDHCFSGLNLQHV